MSNTQSLQEFVDYVKQLQGDEKGEAQLFCDRFFRAFGYGGIIEATGRLRLGLNLVAPGVPNLLIAYGRHRIQTAY